MELLFKREQNPGLLGRVTFMLWAKLELTTDEQALIDRYNLDESPLIGADDDKVVQTAIRIGVVVAILVAAALSIEGGGIDMNNLLAGGIIGPAAGYWYLNEKRQTIFVKDLLLGRTFKCFSVVDLAKKEAWLEGTCTILRQVMESAKHWDGIERHTIDPLPKEQAKELILRAA